MIIQVIGVVAYFTGRLISQTKAPFIIGWLNIILALFMPISLIATFIVNRVIAPYPLDMLSGFLFAIIYVIIMVASFFALKKYKSSIRKQ